MLVIKAYINHKEIDEIHIQNTGICVNEAMQTYEYKIVKPRGYGEFPIFHMRELGWRVLTKQATDIIERVAPRLRKLNKKKKKVKKEKKK